MANSSNNLKPALKHNLWPSLFLRVYFFIGFTTDCLVDGSRIILIQQCWNICLHSLPYFAIFLDKTLSSIHAISFLYCVQWYCIKLHLLHGRWQINKVCLKQICVTVIKIKKFTVLSFQLSSILSSFKNIDLKLIFRGFEFSFGVSRIFENRAVKILSAHTLTFIKFFNDAKQLLSILQQKAAHCIQVLGQ